MRRFSAFFGLIALFLLACGLPGLSRPPQRPTVESVPVSEEAAQQFEEKVGQLGQVQPGETVVLTITEEEITSYIAVNLAQSSDVQDIQVNFRDGRIYISGTVPVGPSKQELFVVLRPYVQEGKMAMEFEEATLGPIGIPDPIKQAINDQIRAAIAPENQVTTIKSITVEEGKITIEATRVAP